MDAEEQEWQQQQQQQRGQGAETSAAAIAPSISGAAFTAPSLDITVANFQQQNSIAVDGAGADVGAGGHAADGSPAARKPSTTSVGNNNSNKNNFDSSSSPPAGTGVGDNSSSVAKSSSVSPPPQAKKKKVFHGDNLEYRYPSGSVYVGSFRDGKLHGYGTYTYHPSKDVYTGEWQNDAKHGKGVYRYDGGDTYTGEWRAGKKHGAGSYKFINGDEYVGGWAEDKIHGFGVFSVARNGNRYEGQWHESYRQGMGVLRSGNGNIYEGQWQRGKEHGAGVLLYPDGKFYAGDWKAGKMDGRGILFEEGQKYLVEHVGGFMVSERVPVPEDAVLDPAYNAANKLFSQVRKVQQSRSHSVLLHDPPSASSSSLTSATGAGGGGGKSDHRLEQLTIEHDMLKCKYEDLLNSKGTPPNGFSNESDPAFISSVEELQQLVRDTRAQRDVQKRRADETKEEVAGLEASVRELQFALDAVKKTAELHDARTGASLDALDMQRRVAELEAQLRDVRDAGSRVGGAAAAAGSAGAGAGAGGSVHSVAGVAGGNKSEFELQARIQLLEGENATLKRSKDELSKLRAEHSELQTKLRDAEFRQSDLEKEVRTLERRGHHDSQEAQGELARTNAMQLDEIRELQRLLAESKAETEAVNQRHKGMIEKMRAAETKGLQAGDLEAQLDMLKKSRAKEQAALERKSEELDQLKQQNATLAREVEELQAASARANLARNNNGGGANTLSAAGAAAAAGGSAGSSGGDFEARLAQMEKERADRDKKEKKKLKKMLHERDEAVSRLNELSQRVGAMSMQLRCLVGSKVLTFARIVSGIPVSGRVSGSAAVGPDGSNTVVVGPGNDSYAMDAVFQQQDGDEAIAATVRELCHAVVGGFNCAVVGFGGMKSGKTASLHSLLPLLLRDTLEPCAAKTSSHEASVTLQAIELSVDGITDLFAGSEGASGGSSEIKILKDCFNSVVFSGCSEAPVSNLMAFRDIAATLQQQSAANRKHKRSHIVYVVNCSFRHRVTGAATFGKLTVADLAGMGSLGEQEDVESAQYINSSVMKLQNVVGALTTAGQTAVPYRDDPLTMALSDALGGNARTIVLAHVPAEANEETMEHCAAALNAAVKAREISNAHVKRSETTQVIELRRALQNIDSAAALPSGVMEIGTIRESA